jgi:hypothetical protein
MFRTNVCEKEAFVVSIRPVSVNNKSALAALMSSPGSRMAALPLRDRVLQGPPGPAGDEAGERKLETTQTGQGCLCRCVAWRAPNSKAPEK